MASTILNNPLLPNPSAPLGQQKSVSDFEPDNKMTVAGQMQGLLANNSKYLQQARAGAQRTANSRGLLNSSMAATAGESAAINAALPIAQQDADTFRTSAVNNQSAYNTGLLNNQQAKIAQDSAVTNYQLTAGLNQQKSDFDKQLAQLQIDADERKTIANMMESQTAVLMSNIGSLLNNTEIKMGNNVTKWMDQYMYKNWQSVATLLGLDIKVT